jgi:hypothetical protein
MSKEKAVWQRRDFKYEEYNISLIEKTILEAETVILGCWTHTVNQNMRQLRPMLDALKKIELCEDNRPSIDALLKRAYYFSQQIAGALYQLKMGRPASYHNTKEEDPYA